MIELIVGLANPGKEYEKTRHNAGAWFIDALLREADASLQPEKKLKASITRIHLHEHSVRLAVPSVYMNLSGQALSALLNFYKISPENVLVVHDEIDFPAGIVRLKFAGGEGGHNGLRSIVMETGSKNF